MSLERLLSALLLASVGPALAAEGYPDPIACLSVSETASNEYGERFHRIGNSCPYDVVIFYCRVIDLPHDPSLAVGTCQRAQRSQLAAFPTAARELGIVNLEAPTSIKTAVRTSAGWLDGFVTFENPYRTSTKPPADLVKEIGGSPAGLYIIKSGAEFISTTTSSNNYGIRIALVPSACPAEMYLNGRCEPDSFAVWRGIGAPESPAAAIDAVSRLGRVER